MTSESGNGNAQGDAAADARPRASNKRFKFVALLALVLLSALTLLSWTQTWLTAQLSQTQNSPIVGIIEVSGEVAAPALSALALAGFALTAALAIAGLVFRYVLAVLQILLGFCIGLSALLVLHDGVAASEPAVTEVTGIAGHESVRTIVSSAAPSPWPVITIILGLGFILSGVFVLFSARRWPTGSKRYRTVAVRPTDAAAEHDDDAAGRGGADEAAAPSDDSTSSDAKAIRVAEENTGGPQSAPTPRMDPVDSWDELTRGDDPTR